MSRNKSFYFRARFGVIYSAFKTKNYFLKNSTISNRLLFYELTNIEFTCPENSNWCLLLPDSNFCLKFPNNFTAKFWATFNYSGILDKKIWHNGFQDHDKVCKYDNYNNTFSHTPKFTTSRIKINEKSWTERFDVAMTPLSSDKIQRKKNKIWLNIIRFEVAN